MKLPLAQVDLQPQETLLLRIENDAGRLSLVSRLEVGPVPKAYYQWAIAAALLSHATLGADAIYAQLLDRARTETRKLRDAALAQA